MATTKKSVTKKPTSKAAATKRTTASKTVAKKPATPKKKTAATRVASSKKVAKKPSMRSFRVAEDRSDFKTFRITRQTIYWIILVSFIVFAQLWILKLQVEVATLIETQQNQLQNF